MTTSVAINASSHTNTKASQGSAPLDMVVVGHVDHGKSTLIGRLLADTGSLPEGKLEQVKAHCARTARPFEYAFLLDALKNEQSQGITIDTARCFFQTARRRYIIHDAPGHIEFLKNMVTGAARAEAALLLIDAAEGIQENSRRHGYIVSMLGIRQLVVVVNKMDLVDYDQEVFDRIEAEYRAFLANLGVRPLRFIPISAREGHNVATRSDRTAWYDGPTVLGQVDAFEKDNRESLAPLRMPVQDIYKFTASGDDRRIVAGTIETGSVCVGDPVVFHPSGKGARIASIERFNAPATEVATAGQALGYTLDKQIYIRPGELMCRQYETPPRVGARFRANIFWMGRSPMIPGRRYKLKIGAARVPVELAEVLSVLDASELSSVQGKRQIDRHDVAEALLETARPIAFDLTGEVEPTARFVIVDGDLIAACGAILEQTESGPTLLQERVRLREDHWDRGYVTAERRAAANRHSGKFIVVIGQDGSEARELACQLELTLHRDGLRAYYLALRNVLDELSERPSRHVMEREEQLQRLGETARMMTDAGLLFITTLPEADGHDLEKLRLLNAPYELFIIAVGDAPLGTFPAQVRLPAGAETKSAIARIQSALFEQGIVLEYEI